MGVHLMRAALRVEPTKLANAPRLVLLVMASHALDHPRGSTPAGLYSQGRTTILGDLAIMPTRTTRRHLTGHLQTLVELGLVKRVGAPGPHRKAVYKLLISVDNQSGRST